MPNRRDTPPTSLGIYDKTKREKITTIEVVALVLSVLWLVVTAVFFLVLEPGGAFAESGGAEYG